MSRCMNCSSPIKRVNTRSQNIFGIMHWQLPFVFCFLAAILWEMFKRISLFFGVAPGCNAPGSNLNCLNASQKYFAFTPLCRPSFMA